MGFVTEWGGQRRLSDLEQVLNERPDTGKLRAKLLKIGPLANTNTAKIWPAGPFKP